MSLTQERLKEVLKYDPETGLFTFAMGRGGRPAGMVAGTLDSNGHVQIRVDRRLHLAHRLAVLFQTGAWPEDEIDHVNGQRDDNRWSNLRAATREQQNWNRCMNRNNSSGFKGVSFHKLTGKWQASICITGRKRHLGLFATAEEARAAFHDAASAARGPEWMGRDAEAAAA